MPETKLKDLYMAKCLDDLDKEYNVPDLKDKRVKMLCNSAQKLFATAEEERLNGDEERSYVFYMKYLNVIQSLKASHCYKTEKQYIMDMIGAKNPFKALDCAEKLKDSLKKRYNVNNQLRKLQDLEEQEEVRQKIEADRRKAKEAHAQQLQTKLVDGLPSKNDISIKCTHLYTLLEEGAKNILVLDARPSVNFFESHIKYPQCISVPEECIVAGSTANKIEQNLPPESQRLWSQRKLADLIVLLDWASSTIVPGKPLHTLKTIFMKWDRQVIYDRAPVILEGGYEEWLFGYPTKTTNPHVIPPAPNTSLDDLLNDIDYPNINYSLSPTEKNPILDRNFKPSFGNFSQADNFNPSVDRSSKAAALLMYEENSKAMKAILEEQEKLADSALNIEKQRVQAEQNWESLRITREKDDEEEMAAKHQLREHELLSELMQLESTQRDMEMENQQLREQLEEYKRKEMSDAANMAARIVNKEPTSSGASSVSNGSPNANFNPVDSFAEEDQKDIENKAMQAILEAAKLEEAQREAKHLAEEAIIKEKRIQAIEEEKAALDRKREHMQAEREKRLAEAREQKKLMNPRQAEDADDDKHNISLNKDGNSSALIRSHSSPDIAQIMDEDEAIIKGKTPQFDRTMKPLHKAIVQSDINQSRQRDFQEVWGCDGPGLTGLRNLGNTCYMNSIMQCLNNTSYLVNYFCKGLYREHVGVSRTSSTHGAVAEEVAAVVKELWSGQYRFISTKDLKNTVGRYKTMFQGVEQQDSHEFLTILMDWLHDDLQIPSRQQIQMDSSPSEKAWQEYTKSKESLILRLFYGQIKSTVKCMVCSKESVTYDSFSNLSLELPLNANRCSLSDCLDLYLSDERILGWNCPSCKEKRDAVKKLDISKLPPVLVIHFKRFYVDAKDYISNTYRKKQTYIDFPLQNLDMSHFSLKRKNTSYNLYGVSNHYGSMEGGHYTAYCKSSYYSKWYKFDDHVVTEISPSDVKSSAAYILFYTSISDSALQQ